MEYRKFFMSVLGVVAAIAGVWLFAAVILPLGFPFFLAFLLAILAEPATECLISRQKLPRWLAGALCVIGIYGVLGVGLFLICRVACRELGDFLEQLPTLLGRLTPMLEDLENTLVELAEKLPDGLGRGLSDSISTFFSTGAGLLQDLPRRAVSFLSDVAQAVPDLLLGAATTLVASFMAAAQLPRLRRWLNRVLPKKWRKWVTVTWQRVRATAGSWLKAECKLMGLTFGIVTLGLLILGADYPLLAGFLIALVDALPVLGTGTVLIPWALVLFLGGQTGRGVAFLVLYGISALARTTLEPRLMGRQMGLNPLLTLAAVYVGFRLAGLAGMILFPMGAAVAVGIRSFAEPKEG